MNPVAARIKLVIVEDHPIFREGLLRVISRDASFEVIGEAEDGLAGEKMIRQLLPDIALLDINLPQLDGLELARRLIKTPVRVVMLTMHKNEEFFRKAMDARIGGYILKENAGPELLSCLRAVARGDTYISPALSGLVLKRMNASADLRRSRPGLDDLTRMERQVLKLLAANKTSREIAAELFLSPHTIQTHRKNISAKLELHGAHGLLQFALEHKAEL
jgi:DNA-binding NarL/FixJ family response regulator